MGIGCLMLEGAINMSTRHEEQGLVLVWVQAFVARLAERDEVLVGRGPPAREHPHVMQDQLRPVLLAGGTDPAFEVVTFEHAPPLVRAMPVRPQLPRHWVECLEAEGGPGRKASCGFTSCGKYRSASDAATIACPPASR